MDLVLKFNSRNEIFIEKQYLITHSINTTIGHKSNMYP